jgi:hypothetical protein
MAEDAYGDGDQKCGMKWRSKEMKMCNRPERHKRGVAPERGKKTRYKFGAALGKVSTMTATASTYGSLRKMNLARGFCASIIRDRSLGPSVGGF